MVSEEIIRIKGMHITDAMLRSFAEYLSLNGLDNFFRLHRVAVAHAILCDGPEDCLNRLRAVLEKEVSYAIWDSGLGNPCQHC